MKVTKQSPRRGPGGMEMVVKLLATGIIPNEPKGVNPAQFLGALYGDNPPGWRAIWYKSTKTTYWLPAYDLAGAEDAALGQAKHDDVYFGVGLQGKKLGSGQRGKAEGVIAIPGLWMDVDCAGGAHTALNLPTEAQAREFLKCFGLEPSIVVHSGGGLHVYWLFARLWVFKDQAARKDAADLLARFQAAMIALAAAKGWRLDNTSDLARVLRVPGTLNHKTNPPAPVRATDWNPERRYTYQEIMTAIADLEALAGESGNCSHSSHFSHQDKGDGPLPKADLIRRKCGWIGHCFADAANLPEPEWYAMLGVIARTDGGRKLCHEWSRPYPGYSERETDEKIDHALKDAGPITCARVRADFGAWCQDCQHKVTSPIVLGYEKQAQPWEPPVPFSEYNLPSFPVNVLPGWMRDYVLAEAEATQTPPDLAGMLALAVCGAAIAKKIVVFVWEGWHEPVNLFTVTALPPGSRKSVVFADVTEPVSEYEREIAQAAAPEIEAQRTEKKIMEAALAQKQSEAAKAKATEQEAKIREATDLARKLAGFQVDALPRLIADDCSPEKLAGLLAEQGGKMALMSPEGGVFEIMAGRYTNGTPNLEVYLKGHAGDDLRVDRVGRPPEYVHGPALTVGLAVQPDVIRGLAQKPGFRGRGLLARFLYALPKPNIGTRKIKPAPVPEHVKAAYRRNVRALLALPAGTNDKGETTAHALRLGQDAQNLIEDFCRWLEPQLPEHAELGSIQDWASKLAGAVARIAGILHVAQHADKPAPWTIQVNGQTMQAAIALGKYLIPHARGAFDEMGADPEMDAARYVLEWIMSREITKITKRDLFNSVRGRFKRVKNLDPALEALEEHGYIRLVDNRPEGAGRPSTFIEVNPYTQNPQNTQKLPIKNNFADIADIAQGYSPPEDAPTPALEDEAAATDEDEWEVF